MNTNGKVVYIAMREDGMVKIGITSSPERRKKEICSSSGFRITKFYQSPVCSNASIIEKYLHEKFKHVRENGEWFKNCFDDAVKYLDEAKKEYFLGNKKFTTSDYGKINEESGWYNTILWLAKDKRLSDSIQEAIDFVFTHEGKNIKLFEKNFSNLHPFAAELVVKVCERNTILIGRGINYALRKKFLEQFVLDQNLPLPIDIRKTIGGTGE